MIDKITKWYNQGLWTIEMVSNAVVKGVITEAEFENITSKVYA